VDAVLLAEADLGLGGVDVDVHLLGRHLQEEQNDREAGGWNDVAVGLRDGVEQQPVTDKAFIDKDIDGVAIEFLELRFGVETGQAQSSRLGFGLIGIDFPGWQLG
jgi:hypothetical protein